MKKIITTIALGCAAAVCALCGCSPKPVTLWCSSIKDKVTFSFEYSAANSAYDGLNRTFTVKNEEDFGEFLTSLDSYAGMMQFADDSQSQAYSFVYEDTVFVCYAKNNEGGYVLCQSYYCIDGYYFVYPPTTTNWDYSVSLDYSGVNTYVTTTVQDWEYFKTFYSYIGDAVVTDVTTTITIDNVTLTVGDGEVTWTIDFGEE